MFSSIYYKPNLQNQRCLRFGLSMVISVVFLPVSFSELSENEKRECWHKKSVLDFLVIIFFLFSIVYFLMVNSCLLFASKHFMITTNVNQRQ